MTLLNSDVIKIESACWRLQDLVSATKSQLFWQDNPEIEEIKFSSNHDDEVERHDIDHIEFTSLKDKESFYLRMEVEEGDFGSLVERFFESNMEPKSFFPELLGVSSLTISRPKEFLSDDDIMEARIEIAKCLFDS